MKQLKKGCNVEINSYFCYANIKEFAYRHPKYAVRWAYNVMPDERRLFHVIGIHKFKVKAKRNYGPTSVENIIVIEDEQTKQIFFIRERGIVVI